MVSTAVDTWGISGPQFLTFYGALCVLVAGWLAFEWRRVVGARERNWDPFPSLGAYKLAMLSGGPQLAITTVAAKLRQAGHLGEGDKPRTLVAQGLLPADADPLEREVFGSVHRSPGISTDDMRHEVAESEPVKHLTQELTQAGLLIEETAAKRLRGLWIFGALLAAVGIVRWIATWSDGSANALLPIAVGAVLIATVKFARRRPFLTARGRAFVRTERQGRPRSAGASASEYPFEVALWGGAALWGADPAFASALGVPREGDKSSGTWSGGGGAGAGCGTFSDTGGGGGGCGGGGGGGCGGGGG